MNNTTDLGMNRTGIGMSPIDSAEMIEGALEGTPMGVADGEGLSHMREAYSADGESIGTVPLPSSVKGVAKSAMDMIKGNKPAVLLDKLGERLAFERTGSRAYEALISKFNAFGTWNGGPTAEDLREFYNDELRHLELVREAIESLGADPTAVTPSADLVGVESQGLIQVLDDPRTTLIQSLHAILVAELVDNDGWQMLVDLTSNLGQEEMTKAFSEALLNETKHLGVVRGWVINHTELEATRDLEASPPDQEASV